MPTARHCAIVLAAVITVGAPAGALAQATAADPHHPDATATEATTPTEPGGTATPVQDARPAESGTTPPGTTPPGTMGQGMMGPGMMGGMMPPGMMGAMPMMPTQLMRGHMMKIMFAVADADGDGGLSFEEISAIHRRIFEAVDADGDGIVTPEEMQAFVRE